MIPEPLPRLFGPLTEEDQLAADKNKKITNPHGQRNGLLPHRYLKTSGEVMVSVRGNHFFV